MLIKTKIIYDSLVSDGEATSPALSLLVYCNYNFDCSNGKKTKSADPEWGPEF